MAQPGHCCHQKAAASLQGEIICHRCTGCKKHWQHSCLRRVGSLVPNTTCDKTFRHSLLLCGTHKHVPLLRIHQPLCRMARPLSAGSGSTSAESLSASSATSSLLPLRSSAWARHMSARQAAQHSTQHIKGRSAHARGCRVSQQGATLLGRI